MTIIIIII